MVKTTNDRWWKIEDGVYRWIAWSFSLAIVAVLVLLVVALTQTN